MKVQIDTQETFSVDMTPEQLGALFANMDSDEQVQFLKGVYDAVCKWPPSIWGDKCGEGQWYFLSKDLKKPENRHARSVLMAMAAPLYRFCESLTDWSHLWWLEHECPDATQEEIQRAAEVASGQ